MPEKEKKKEEKKVTKSLADIKPSQEETVLKKNIKD
jgi:hypothetical protein